MSRKELAFHNRQFVNSLRSMIGAKMIIELRIAINNGTALIALKFTLKHWYWSCRVLIKTFL